MSASYRRGPKGAARNFVAAGPAGPDPKARRVTAEMCRVDLQRPDLTDEEAEAILDHLYSVASVSVDAFIEQRGRTGTDSQDDSLAVLGNESLAPAIHAA
jgi:hypothetical protein